MLTVYFILGFAANEPCPIPAFQGGCSVTKRGGACADYECCCPPCSEPDCCEGCGKGCCEDIPTGMTTVSSYEDLKPHCMQATNKVPGAELLKVLAGDNRLFYGSCGRPYTKPAGSSKYTLAEVGTVAVDLFDKEGSD